MTIEWQNVKIRLGDLKPWEENPRQSTPAQAKRILQSMDDFGQVQTVAISPDGEVYDGHQRLSALLAAYGADYELDARQSSRALSDYERRGLVLALHATAAGQWDWDALADWDLPSLLPDGFANEWLDGLNYDGAMVATFLDSELDALGEETESDAEPQVSRADELQAEWGTELGQLWQIGEHRLLIGDCTVAENVERLMGGEKADMVFTDPPYGISVVKDNMVGADFGIAKKGTYSAIIADDSTRTAHDFYKTCVSCGMDNFIIWGGNYFVDFLPFSDGWLVWNKRGDTGIRNTFADGELAWCSFHTPIRIYNQLWNGMIREGESGARVHPTQKPVRLIQDIINDHVKGSVLYDGFLGSGSTMVAAQNLGRKCYGMELSQNYSAVILQRMKDAFPNIEIKMV